MALDLGPEEALNQFHSGSNFVSSIIHYPALSAHHLSSDQLIRNPAHSDFGTFTLLFQHQVGGLQVADMSSTDKRVTANVEKTARFIPVESNNDILVLPGYVLRRWTNNIYPGAVHRVTAPVLAVDGDEAERTTERYSFAYFVLPDENTTIEAFSTCYSDERPKKWAPMDVGEFLRRKRLGARS
jgi:isopenicillin N synthase-like dioxygenase